MNKNDLRYIKTEKIIKESFKKCVEKHGFEKVTVSMICEEGLISRNAFYLHFTDKYDLLDRLFDEFRASLLKNYDQNITESVAKNDVLTSTKLYAEAILNNRLDFLFLIKCSRNKMDKVIKEIIIDYPNKKTIKNYEKICENFDVQLNIRYMFTAMVAYTELWFENFEKISKEEAIYNLYKLCESPTTLFRNYFI
ncbi:MAG: TetR family transcriptional regulator [Oscillospiraceae bacterium]|nr:TetR family transcriptional regulator [Oscillospiraceae bacterium]MBR6656979.1 TetR family transcriptional regulator [Oscillospiraceae bacterium]